MKYSGRCACGQVTLRISGAPVAERQCWCRQCQYFAGGGPAHNAMFSTDDVHIDDAMGTHDYVAASGNTITQWFCVRCATPIYAQSSARRHFRTVRMGVIDQPHDLAPKMVIWTEEAPPWALIDPNLERHARQPAPPGSATAAAAIPPSSGATIQGR